MFNFDFKRFVWQIGDYTSSPSDLKTLKLGLGFGLGLGLGLLKLSLLVTPVFEAEKPGEPKAMEGRT